MTRQMDRYEKLYRELLASKDTETDTVKNNKILSSYLNTMNNSVLLSPHNKLNTTQINNIKAPRFFKTRNSRPQSLGMTTVEDTKAQSSRKPQTRQMKHFKELQNQTEDRRQLSNLLDLMNIM